MTLSLGIDIGTSGVRTAVVDETGTPVSMARVGHLPQSAEQIDARAWWDATRTCIAKQIAALDAKNLRGGQITRIAVDGTSGSMVLTDDGLQPVTRALMYNSKGFKDEALLIDRVAPETHITRGSNSALARAMRLVSEDRDQRARHLLHQADFIAASLTGQAGISDHCNALKTGFNPGTEHWPDWIDAVIDPSLLPRPLTVGSIIGPVAPGVAAELGLPSDARVAAGTTDSIAAFIAAAPILENVAVTSLGSTLAIKVLGTERIDDPAIGLYSHRLGDLWLAGGASNTGGAVLSHYFSDDALAELSAGIDVSITTGLDYYPLLEPGERFPINDPDLQPRLSPRPENDVEFLHGMLEGIARIEAQAYRAIETRGGRFPDAVYSAGGGAGSEAFTAIRARALGLRPSVSGDNEAAIGTARLAAGVSRLAQTGGL